MLQIDVCLSLPCGINANCETSNGEYSCSCPDDMAGDPNIKCEGIHLAFFNLYKNKVWSFIKPFQLL